LVIESIRGKPITVISVCLDSETRNKLEKGLNSISGLKFVADFQQYLGGASDLELVHAVKSDIDVCVVDFDRDRASASRTAEQLYEIAGGRTAIFAVSVETAANHIITSMRSGCSEYLLKPLQLDQVAAAFQKIIHRKQEQGGREAARVFTLIGVKGGSGVTTLAIHLATFLARSGRKTLLIDQHSDLGDAPLYLGFDRHRYHFYELASNLDRLDSELLQGFVLQHESGLHVLASPESFDAVTQVSIANVEDTIGFLRGRYEFIVIDCHPSLTGFNTAAMAKSDELYLVATPELPSIRNLARYLEHLRHFNYPAERTRLVVNRHSKKDVITLDQIEKAVAKRIFVSVPNSYTEVIQAINTGHPLLPGDKSEFARTIGRWSQHLAVSEAVTAQEVRKHESKRGLGILGL
jgi:pilus assembly protein CpaE